MKQTNIILLAVALVLIIGVSTFGALTILTPQDPQTNPTPTPTQSPTKTPTSNPTITATPTPKVTMPPTATPTKTTNPITTPQPEPVTVTDANGAEVTVQRPVERIVCLTSVEIVYALGGGSKIVGIAGMLTTDVQEVLPASILALPTVGDRDSAPNMEVIMELEPDLVLASQRLSDANRQQLENAGIAVIEDSTTGARRNQYITNLGLILDKQTRANEIMSYEQHYWNLVEERVGTLDRSQKPLVYFEWYKEWFSTGPGGSYSNLIEAAGGINVGENATTSSPQLSGEFVIEQNPNFVIRMLDYTSGETYNDFQNLYTSITSRTGMNDLTAVKTGHVYVIKSNLLVERDVVGLLYFAKWFHPELFTDINPAAVHAEMLQMYYGSSSSATYLYP